MSDNIVTNYSDIVENLKNNGDKPTKYLKNENYYNEFVYKTYLDLTVKQKEILGTYLKKDNDNPSIGLLLCKNKNNLVAEYALKDMSKPIGISEYKITNNLPEELEKQLPSVEDIQSRITRNN